MIDYERIVPAILSPKFAYHGFKYDEVNSYPPQGDYGFSRSYWCASQTISICLVEYDREEAKAVISSGEDSPSEVPPPLLRIREPGFRLWLSNRYLTVALQSDNRTINLVPHHGIIRDTSESIINERLVRVESKDLFRRNYALVYWWEFQGEADLRRTLNSIVTAILDHGLDWFEEQIADVKRYHQKLERRRQTAKRRRTSTE
jgi:hypothetical protein